MSCAQMEIGKKPKLVINPLALVMRSCSVSKNNHIDSSWKKEFRKNFEKTDEDNFIQRETHESVISIDDDEESDVSESETIENVETLAVQMKEKIKKRNVKVLNFLYESIIKESITYSLGLIKDFVLDCDSENIVFADKFPFAVVKFLGLLFDAEQSFVETMLDAGNFKTYNDLNELVQNKPFRVFCHFESKLRRITFLKKYIASNDYETSSFIKMNLSDAACSLSDAEVNMAPEQSFDSQNLDNKGDLKFTLRHHVTVDLTEDPKLTANNELVIDVERGKVEMRSSGSAKEDRAELSPAKKTKRITKKQAARLHVEKAKSLTEVRTSVLQEGLDTPVQCSIAERMMRNMGWDGGALGVNGTGITEPIKPNFNRKTSYGLGHVNAIANPKTSIKTNEGSTEKKPRKENNKRDKRSQKRMERLLVELNLRKDMRKRQQEIDSLEKEVEWDVSDGMEENTKKGRWAKKNKVNKFQLVVLVRLLEFVCDPEEHEMCFDQTYNDQKRARIHRLVDHINEGGHKHMPSGWNQELVGEICDCNISYLVSESIGEGNDRRLSIFKLPMQAVQFVDEDLVMARESGTRCWNHLEVVAGNLLQIMIEFLQDDMKEEIRFTGEWNAKTRNFVNNFLRQLKEACDIDVTESPVTEIERLMHDSYKRQPDVTLRITGQILKHCRFNSVSAKIVKVSRKIRARNSNMIVID